MIGVRDYAKHRGVSPAAVSKAIKAGRLKEAITRDSRGHPKIMDLEAADAEWERNTQQRSEAHAPSPKATTTRAPVQPLPPGVPAFAESRARNEAAKSGILTLQLLEAKGRLVNVEGVRDAIAMKFAEIRTKLLGVPHRLQQRSSTISAKDRKLVDTLIRESLEALADEISTY